ncbi:MAG: ABC transporter ATP-binding protein/permease [Defluviitaleaceae bacterium]|nr:ABC transporter ATP-binding protein/permease [Defluviitaleaceae bacterium]
MKTFKILLSMNKTIFKYKPHIFLFNIIIWFFIITFPLIISLIISNILSSIENGNYDIFIRFVFILSIITVTSIVSTYIGGILDTLFRFYCKSIIQFSIVKNKIYTDYNFDSGKVINILEEDAENLKELLSIQIDTFCNLVFYIAGISILLSINPLLTIIVFSTSFIFFNISILMAKLLSKFTDEQRLSSISSTEILQKIISKKKIVKSIDKNKKYMEALEEKFENEYKKTVKKEVLENILNSLGAISYNVSTLVIIIYTAININNSHINIAQILLFLTFFSYGFNNISIFIEFWNLIKISEISIKNINQVTRDNVLLNINYKIEDDNDIKIQNENQFVFNNNVFEKNKIYYDCTDELYKYITKNMICGIVKSDFSLITDTIAKNIAYTNDIDKSKLENILETVSLKEEFKKRDIYNEVIFENNINISTGQKQRLSIARALYNTNEFLIIFKEVFNHIDEKNVNVITENLKNINMYVFII